MPKIEFSISGLTIFFIVFIVLVVLAFVFFISRRTDVFEALHMCDPFSTMQMQAVLTGGPSLHPPMPVFVGKTQVGTVMEHASTDQKQNVWLCIDSDAATQFNISSVCYQNSAPANTLQCITLDTTLKSAVPNQVVVFTSYEDFFVWRTKSLLAAGFDAALQNLRKALEK